MSTKPLLGSRETPQQVETYKSTHLNNVFSLATNGVGALLTGVASLIFGTKRGIDDPLTTLFLGMFSLTAYNGTLSVFAVLRGRVVKVDLDKITRSEYVSGETLSNLVNDQGGEKRTETLTWVLSQLEGENNGLKQLIKGNINEITGNIPAIVQAKSSDPDFELIQKINKALHERATLQNSLAINKMGETQSLENKKIANAFGGLNSLMEPVLGHLGLDIKNIEILKINAISNSTVNEAYKIAYTYLIKLTEKTTEIKQEITQKENELNQFKQKSEQDIKKLKTEIDEIKKTTEQKKQQFKKKKEQLEKEKEELKSKQSQQQTSLTTQTLKSESTEQSLNSQLEIVKEKFEELEKTSKKQSKELKEKESEIKKLENKLTEAEKSYQEERVKKENQIQKLFSTYSELEHKARQALKSATINEQTIREYEQYISLAANTLQELVTGGFGGINSSLDSLNMKPVSQIPLPIGNGPLVNLIIQVNSTITYINDSIHSGASYSNVSSANTTPVHSTNKLPYFGHQIPFPTTSSLKDDESSDEYLQSHHVNKSLNKSLEDDDL